MIGLTPWLASAGCKGLEHLRFDDAVDDNGESAGVGCYALKDFNCGDVMFEVPQKCIMSAINVRNSSVATALKRYAAESDKLPLVSAELLIWMEMCKQREDQSGSFHPYMQSLSELEPTISSWTPALLEGLEGTNLGGTMRSGWRERLHEQADLLASFIAEVHALETYKHVRTEVPSLETWSSCPLLWARGHYLSRRYPGKFAISVDSTASGATTSSAEGRELGFRNLGALVPLLDILNHKPGTEWLTFRPTEQSLQVLCKEPIKKVTKLSLR
jgi:hypothetical protein